MLSIDRTSGGSVDLRIGNTVKTWGIKVDTSGGMALSNVSNSRNPVLISSSAYAETLVLWDIEIVLNQLANDTNTRIEGLNNDYCFFLDAGNDNITINATSVSANYDLMLAGDGVLGLKETTTPTADTNYGKIYTTTLNSLYFQDGAGIEHNLVGLDINAQTGTSYTLLDSDKGKLITLDNGSAIDLTVPSGLESDFWCAILQKGAGQVTIGSDTGVTVNQADDFNTTEKQWVKVSIEHLGSDVYVIEGRLE